MRITVLFRPLFLFPVLLAAPIFAVAPALAQTAPKTSVASAIPDVRGLEYREVTLARPIGASERYIEGAKSSPQPAVHLWIRPAKDGETVRGIGWNGVEYDLQSVGKPADWRADVEAQLKPKPAGTRYHLPRAFEFSGGPIAQLYLNWLGAPELRRQARLGRVSYGDADPEREYHRNLRDAGVSAFVKGDSSVAKRQLETLLAALPAEIAPNVYNPREEATRVLADIARRETNEPRPSEEIAGLLWDLQNVRSFSGWNDDRTVQKLIDAGDRAVEPLLGALENDDRLTLAVRVNNFRVQRSEPIATVRDVAQNTLNQLLKHFYSVTDYRLGAVAGQKQLAQQMRADWEKVRGQTPTGRIFDVLSLPGQTPQRLEEAARELVRIGKPYNSNIIYVEKKNGVYTPIPESQTFFGEPLRNRQNPSVSEVLEARIGELSSRALSGKPTANALDPSLPSGPDTPDAFALSKAMRAANMLALVATKWDVKRGAPQLEAQLERAKLFAAKSPRGLREDAERGVWQARQQFLQARLKTPHRAAALREYSARLQSRPFGRFSAENYAPLWQFPTEPALQSAAKALFAAARRPFQAAAQFQTRDFDYDSAFRLLQSPLIKTAHFKAAVARELSNKTGIGTLKVTRNGEAEIKITAWDWSGQPVKITVPRLENGTTQTLRVCDLVGFWLEENRPGADGRTRTYPLLDVSLPLARRDARLAQIRVLLAQNRVWSDEDRFAGWTPMF